MIVADINVRYWKMYETRADAAEKIGKVILGISNIMSLLAWALDKKYLPVATATSAFTALWICVIWPALGLNSYSKQIVGVRNRWIDLRDAFEQIWDEFETNGNCPTLDETVQLRVRKTSKPRTV